jgi:hypothetical protein
MCEPLEFILLGKFMRVPNEIGCRYRQQHQCYWHKTVMYPSPRNGYNMRVNALKAKNHLPQPIKYAQAGDEYVIAKQRLGLYGWCAQCTAPGLRTAPRLHGAVNTRWSPGTGQT